MPYIITTFEAPPGSAVDWEDPVSRRAVATLDEARDRIICDPLSAHDDHSLFPHWRSRALMLPESGGTIGPLPDGTVIEVRPMTRDALVRAVGETRYIAGMTAAEMADAYNARSNA